MNYIIHNETKIVEIKKPKRKSIYDISYNISTKEYQNKRNKKLIFKNILL